jgi:hypothetical protein
MDTLCPCLAAGGSTSATVALCDDVGGPLSTLTKTGPNQITLHVAHTYAFRGPPFPTCNYNYTVRLACFPNIALPFARCVLGTIRMID